MARRPRRRQTRRTATAAIADALSGSCAAVLADHLRRLRELPSHPNRLLHYDDVFVALLLGFYDPAVRSLRTLDGRSVAEPHFKEQLGIDRVARSTLSDALRSMSAEQLLPIVRQLHARLPGLAHADGDLAALLKRIIALDGSVFTVPADVLWAVATTRSNGNPGRQIRLNLALDVVRFVPESLSISGDDGLSEGSSFIRHLEAGVIYLADRNFVDFPFMHAVLDVQSDFVVRGKIDKPKFIVTQETAITDEDRSAAVTSDRLGTIPGSAGSPGFGDRPFREVMVLDPRSGKPVRLLTTLLCGELRSDRDVPAHVIGKLYRHRWMIELFFRWLKCVAKVEHLMSTDANGITMQLYVGVIAVLLMYLRSGRRPGTLSYSMLQIIARGTADLSRVPEVLERHERERELERARLARKKKLKV